MDAANELPIELERAAERFDNQQARWVKLEGYGATDYALAIAGQSRNAPAITPTLT